MHWTEAFTRKLSADAKLVGSFVSCEGTPKGGAAAAEWRLNPYVMPHAWATDKVGRRAGGAPCQRMRQGMEIRM